MAKLVDARDLKSRGRKAVWVRDPLRVYNEESTMRTVRDHRGVTWICLELPAIPTEQLPEANGVSHELVAIECNSGAERVIALVAPGWDDVMSDAQLAETISSGLR